MGGSVVGRGSTVEIPEITYLDRILALLARSRLLSINILLAIIIPTPLNTLFSILVRLGHRIDEILKGFLIKIRELLPIEARDGEVREGG